MKSLILLLLTVFLFNTNYAQNLDPKDVPQLVKDKLKSSYSRAIDVKWNKEKTGYEASFKYRKKDMSVNFDEKGKIIEVETQIQVAALPVEVREAIATNYPKNKINEAAKIVRKGIVMYEAEITVGEKLLNLYYDEHGTLKKLENRKAGK
jgi:hypothetical protein